MRNGLRTRLIQCITDKYKSCDSAAVRLLADSAHVSYTTVARFVLYEPVPKGRAKTRQVSSHLRQSTIEALAVKLEVSATWLRDGQEPKQLGLWPILVGATAETKPADAAEELRLVLGLLRELPAHVCIKAARAAVAGILDTTVRNGYTIGPEAYRSLMRLDALHGSPACVKAG